MPRIAGPISEIGTQSRRAECIHSIREKVCEIIAWKPINGFHWNGSDFYALTRRACSVGWDEQEIKRAINEILSENYVPISLGMNGDNLADFTNYAQHLVRKLYILGNLYREDRMRISTELRCDDSRFDARRSVFGQFESQLSCAEMFIHMYADPSVRMIHYGNETNRQLLAERFEEFFSWGRQQFFNGIVGIVEIFFRRLLEALGKDSQASFYRTINILLRDELDSIPENYVNLLSMLRHARNSHHHGGIHLPLREEDNEIDIIWAGEEYKFRKGVRVNFVTIENTTKFAEHIRLMINMIIRDKKILSIHEILDENKVDSFAHLKRIGIVSE